MDSFTFSDAEYGKVLDNFVIACVDVAVIYGDMILLERRANEPIRGEWWIFGGRMRRGETLVQAAARNVSREIGLDIQPKRFFEAGVYNLMWPTRREPDISNGCQHLLLAHAVRIEKDEFEKINEQIEKHTIAVKWHDHSNIISGQYLKEVKDIALRAIAS